MAKSKSFFGLRRGSTKSLTFQVLNGRQVTKDRVYDVKNPRTLSQMQQRMVMATAAAAYAGMREIVDHSFEGYTYGQPTMSEFIRLNAKILRQGLTDGTCIYNPYQDRGALPNPYIVSKGTLSHRLSIAFDSIADSEIGIVVSYDDVALSNVTFREWLVQNGLSVSGYITLLCLAYSPETNIHQFGYIRLTPRYEMLNDVLEDMQLLELFDIETNVPIFGQQDLFTENQFVLTFDFDQGGIMMVSFAGIISEKKLKWNRSTSYMLTERHSSYTPPTPAETLATYPVGTDYILNGGTV